jgi:hypothetical protein
MTKNVRYSALNDFGTGDAFYGVRNLAVGDDEQTRVAELFVPGSYGKAIDALCELGKYEQAYEMFIQDVLNGFAKEDVVHAAKLWWAEWTSKQSKDQDDLLESERGDCIDEQDFLNELERVLNGR